MKEQIYSYFFEFRGERTHLFNTRNLLYTEKESLGLYETGLLVDLFSFDMSSINQHWAELALWGMIGRCEPVELLKILCAHGGRIKAYTEGFEGLLEKSYRPVKYQIEMHPEEHGRLRNVLAVRLGDEESDLEFNPFLYSHEDGILNLGSYYLEEDSDADTSFPIYFKNLEKDICLKAGELQLVLAQLFHLGFKIEAVEESMIIVLSEYNVESQVIKGYGNENTLFYLGDVKLN